MVGFDKIVIGFDRLLIGCLLEFDGGVIGFDTISNILVCF